jgi:hypothetical protein
MVTPRSRSLSFSFFLIAAALATTAHPDAWGAQGHRLVALVAAAQLTPQARQNVQRLLGDETLADVSIWADEYLVGNNQTAFWHYVNIPADARSYDRDRDCPRQPGVAAGGRGDIWRDCVVDRIAYSEERLANPMLDRSDRAIALKFLVHFVADIHQPFHASAVERGGNGILVRVFGSDSCGGTPDRPVPCNLHSVWDTQLIAHRGLNDGEYARRLERLVAQERMARRPAGLPAEWAMESLVLANTAMLPQRAEADEAYYQRHIGTIDERLALGGVRLAALVNRSLGGRVR